ncbi:hypothetical protein USDA257_c34890 [Sinorhizobium fredii USDA 257]|uniref:Uncharacterized protein n=1 Tax=Sinorhizobium fredii (strain USDA 257) TaxID=1185652 RepID=I3X842_SINF2|nr:hypothetical protein USDA257_c34890 [Sinorhizobium fredii USDA 257]
MGQKLRIGLDIEVDHLFGRMFDDVVGCKIRVRTAAEKIEEKSHLCPASYLQDGNPVLLEARGNYRRVSAFERPYVAHELPVHSFGAAVGHFRPRLPTPLQPTA